MPKVVIIDKSNLEILHTYEETWETDHKKFTDLYGDENSTIHLQVPENIIYEYIQVVRDTETDEIKIKENETKKKT
jgi:L-rhamnose mutarotase